MLSKIFMISLCLLLALLAPSAASGHYMSAHSDVLQSVSALSCDSGDCDAKPVCTHRYPQPTCKPPLPTNGNIAGTFNSTQNGTEVDNPAIVTSSSSLSARGIAAGYIVIASLFFFILALYLVVVMGYGRKQVYYVLNGCMPLGNVGTVASAPMEEAQL
ncbi:hypothetical protein B484DRAFT_453991 [Ochromonadaceae sp. CCMP2298]|nr:hypothetical protein B484DRAFT_453991 [Ochromonadaceae sp. CCMP2298]